MVHCPWSLTVRRVATTKFHNPVDAVVEATGRGTSAPTAPAGIGKATKITDRLATAATTNAHWGALRART
ncbi:MAG TPA: hypothetical protein VMT69_11355 [Kineosporiaceae bacterium]|nr:hypothetical protein [Kineosporiaceae bacterium]